MVLLSVIRDVMDLLTACRLEMSRLRHCPFCVCHETLIPHQLHISMVPLLQCECSHPLGALTNTQIGYGQVGQHASTTQASQDNPAVSPPD